MKIYMYVMCVCTHTHIHFLYWHIYKSNFSTISCKIYSCVHLPSLLNLCTSSTVATTSLPPSSCLQSCFCLSVHSSEGSQLDLTETRCLLSNFVFTATTTW